MQLNNNEMFETLKTKAIFFVMFVSGTSIAAIILTKDVFQKFVPRSIVFGDSTLTFLFASSTLVICISFLITGIYNMLFYMRVKKKNVPFKGYYWAYSIRSLCAAAVFASEFVSVFSAFYWTDIIIRLVACWFCIALVFLLITSYKYWQEVSPPEVYEKLIKEMEELKSANKKLKELESKIQSEDDVT